MKQLFILLLLTLLQLHNSESALEDIDEAESKHNVRIQRIQITGERQYMQVAANIHEDRTHFDIHVMLNRQLGSNYLIMNTSLRGKVEGAKDFKKMLELKRMDLCEFLTEYKENSMMRYFFKKSMQLDSIMVCPLRVSNYSVVNINVADNLYPQGMLKGTYKFYVEVVEPIGELPKVFAMQVTTQINM